MKKTVLYLALSAIALTGINSCENLENLCNIGEDDLGTGEVFVTSLNHMIDIYTRIDNANKDSVLNATSTNVIDGAVCTKTPDSLIIDYGITEVLCADGKLRKGSIRSKVTGDYTVVGGQINSIFSGYFVNGVQIKGYVFAENKGPATNPDFDVNTTNFKVGEESNVNFNLGMLWQDGFSTPDMSDDIFDVSGTVSGDDYLNSKEFTSKIVDPIHYVNSCTDLIESGIIKITLTGDSTISTFEVDFIAADGCNNLFKATVDCEGSPISFTYPFN